MATETINEVKVIIDLNNGSYSTVPLYLENIDIRIGSYYDKLINVVDALEACLCKEVVRLRVKKESYITR